MEPMTEIERIEYCFKAWLEKYNDENWALLTREEVDTLLDHHYVIFAKLLWDMTKEGYPPFEKIWNR